MKNQFGPMLMSLLAGMLIPVQAATNAAFSRVTGTPFITGLIVFVTGLLAVLAYVLVSGQTFPSMTQLKNAPWYGYMGGLIVAFYVIVITFAAPRLGVASAIGLVITGQVIGAVAIDHFGLFDTAVRALDLKRLAGVFCMIAGIYLVMKK